MAEPILFGTQKDYAWDAFQTAFDAGKLLPDRTYFETWWTEVGLTVQWKDLRQMFEAAWGSGVQCRNIACTAGFNAWWQQILDAQPVPGTTGA
jgi:hypothetical protein